MAFELMTEGQLQPQYVDDLCPADLQYRYGQLVRQRQGRQREQLHIQVAAAAVIADGGKSAKEMDAALSVATTQSTISPNDAPQRRMTLDQLAEVQR
jgi:hypothetical protein